MTFGYIRVSKTIQNYDLQEDAMKKQHCDKLFFEKESGVKYREEWNTLYGQLRDGDTVKPFFPKQLKRFIKCQFPIK